MKSLNSLLLLISIFAITSCGNTNSEKAIDNTTTSANRAYYQLKIYTFDSDNQVSTVDKYLEEAYLPGLKNLGINNIGVFKRKLNEADSIRKTYVLIPFTSIDQFLTLEDKLMIDEKYKEAGSDYLNVSYEHPPYYRIESILLKAFEDMPQLKTPSFNSARADRVYELRSYESPTEEYFKNKVEMFNEGGEINIFDKLEFNAVFYGEVISGAQMPNLMYMTTFSDQASRDTHWDAFGSSPEWNELVSISKYNNNVSHSDINFLYPTEYSDY